MRYLIEKDYETINSYDEHKMYYYKVVKPYNDGDEIPESRTYEVKEPFVGTYHHEVSYFVKDEEIIKSWFANDDEEDDDTNNITFEEFIEGKILEES